MRVKFGPKLIAGLILAVLAIILLYTAVVSFPGLVSRPIPSEIFQLTQIQVGSQTVTKIADEPGWETHFVSAQLTADSFIIRFYHDAPVPQPVWIECLPAQLSNEDVGEEIEGCIDSSLSTDLAQPNQTVTLTVPLVAGQVPQFRLHIGPDSEIFEFGPLQVPGPPTPCSNGICQDSIQDDFNNGTYNQTFYNATEGYVQVNQTFTSGNFTSRVFDSGTTSNWANISWVEESPELELGQPGDNMTANVLLMHLNNDSNVGENASLVYDYSGQGNNGTWYGTQDSDSGWNCTDARLGDCALMFDGSGDYINITDDDSIDFGTGNFSIEYWFKESVGGDAHIWKKHYPGSQVGYYSYMDGNGKIVFCVGNFGTGGEYRILRTDDNYSNQDWHQAVLTKSGQTLNIWVDGVDISDSLTTDGTIGNIDNAQDLLIGRATQFGGMYFDGLMDEVAIWNRTLSADEIREHYNRGAFSLTVQSCDDPSCTGDAWNETYRGSPQNLSVDNNQYFRYEAGLESNESKLYNVTISYTGNVPPNTTEMVLNSTSGNNYTTDNLTCWARGTDVENTTLAAYWSWYKDGVLNTSGYTPGLTNNTLNLTTTLLAGNTSKGETWNCSVKMFDGEDNETVWNNASLTILNTPPTISPSIPDQTKDSGVYWSYDANATDPDVDDGVDALTWYINNSMLDINLSTGLISDTPDESETGSYWIEVNVTDGEAWGTDTFLYTITDATPPTWHKNNTNGSDSTKTGEAVYFNITFRDNYQPGYYIFSLYNGTDWVNDSAQAWTNNTEIEVIKTITATRGQTVQWYWWFNDSSGNSNQTDTWSFTVNNTRPEAQSVLLNSSDDPLNRTTGTLQAFWTFYDADGDTEQDNQTKWYNNSAEQALLENSTTVAPGNTTKGQVWNFSVRVSDGTDWSAWANSNTLTILNSPPEHDTPILNSTTGNNLSSDDLYCWNQSTSDIDGDSVTNIYTWYNDSVIQPGLENATMVLAGNTSGGEIWYCNVTPWDSYDYGISRVSNTLQIIDTDPPVTYLLSPPDGSNSTSPETEFIYNSTDVNDVANCSLWLQPGGGAWNLTATKHFDKELDVDPDMALFMHLNNDSLVGENNTHAYDYSGNGNNGTLMGNAFWNCTDPKLGACALDLDGTEDYIQVPDSNTLDMTDRITIEAWIYRRDLTLDDAIVRKNGAYYLYFASAWEEEPSGLQFYIESGGIDPLNTSERRVGYGIGNFTTNTWYYVVGTWDNNYIKLYVNGVVVDSEPSTGTTAISANSLGIGAIGGTGALPFNGLIDEVAIYNRSMSAAEILQHYEQGNVFNQSLNHSINSTLSGGSYNWTIECSDEFGNPANATNGPYNYTYLSPWLNCPGDTENGIWNITSDYTITSDVNCSTINITNNADLIVNSSGAGNAQINITVSNLTIYSGSSITATGTGYINATGSGAGNSSYDTWSGAGGAGHGGYGGDAEGNVPYPGGSPYGSSLEPATSGSGGGDGTGGAVGGSGGGAIKIIVSDTFTLNGAVTADGVRGDNAPGTNGAAGGGSGGSIHALINTLTGSGNFSAKGGAGGSAGWVERYGGGGAGGRIVVYYNISTLDMTKTRVSGGTGGGNAEDGEPGTLAFIDQDDNHLFIYEGFRWQSSDKTNWNYNLINITNADTRINATAISVNSTTDTNLINSSIDGENNSFDLNLTAAQDIILINSNITTLNNTVISAVNFYVSSELSDITNLTIIVTNFTFSSGSTITATGTGYAGGSASNDGQGPGGGKTLASNSGGGAGHGGHGGQGWNGGAGGLPYEYSLTPTSLGSGGGGGDGGSGGAGAGAIRIDASDTFVLNGTIEADGTGAPGWTPGNKGGGGSGGTIHITTDTLTGTGNLSAKGGNGGYSSNAYHGGGGAGGRIAVHFNTSTLSDMSASKVTGGLKGGNNAEDGEPGTLAFIDQDDSKLFIYDGFRFQANDVPSGIWNHTQITAQDARLTANITPIYFNTSLNFTSCNFTWDTSGTRELFFIYTQVFSDTNTNYQDGFRLTLHNESSGIVDWINTSLQGIANLSQHTDILDNSIRVNSTAVSGLNTSANLTLYGISFIEPKAEVAYDDVSFQGCTHCENISYVGNTFKFNTTRFTTFRAAEGFNTPPNTTEMVLNSTSGNNYTTDNLTCWARGEDAENTTLAAHWQWWNGTNLILEGYTPGLANSTLNLTTTLLSGNTTKGQTWNCSVKMFDGTDNETDWNNRSLTILNTPPELNLTPLNYMQLPPNTYNDTINLSNYLTDPDTSLADINWSCSSNETFVTATASNVTKLLNISATNNFLGLVNVTCTAFDPDPATVTDSFLVDVTGIICGSTLTQDTTLTNNLQSNGTCFTIGADDITLDCADHTITGDGTGSGIYLFGRTNVTIKNCKVYNFSRGIHLDSSSVNTLTNNTANNNTYGIRLDTNSNSNTLINNIANNNTDGTIGFGIYLGTSSNYNILTNNTANYNTGILEGSGIVLDGSSSHNTLTNNTANYNSFAGLGLYSNPFNNTLTSNTANNNTYGIYISTGSNNTITSNTAKGNDYGIRFDSSSNNNLTSNNASYNTEEGIRLQGSSSNTLTSNTANNNSVGGIHISQLSHNNTLTFNTANNNTNNGIYVYSNSSTLINNTANYNKGKGIYIYISYLSVLTNNTANNNNAGITIEEASNNNITSNIAKNNIFQGIGLSQDANNNIVANNTATSNENGILLYRSSSNTLINNTANSNTNNGIYLLSGSNSNTLTNNTMTGNTNYALRIESNSGNTLLDQLTKTFSYYFSNTATLAMHDTNKSKVRFLDNITESGANLSIDIVLGNNSVFINSSAQPGFNVSANLTLYSLTFTDPRPTWDPEDDGSFVACPASICTELDYTGGAFKYNVTRFTTYSSNETPPVFNITWPEGVYEPICCGDGSTGEGATCTDADDVNCDDNTTLYGTHKHTFNITFESITVGAGDHFCYIEISNGTVLLVNDTHPSVAVENLVLSYTLPNMSASAINKSRPWIIKNCTIRSGGSVHLENTTNQTLYVHLNTWYKFIEGGDSTDSLSCYTNVPEKYFNNSRKCTWEGDLVFSYKMANQNTLEGWCHDGINNDGEDGTDCVDPDCTGLTYFTCPNATSYNESHPPIYSPICNPDTNICYGSITIGADTVYYEYTQWVKPSGTLKVRFNNGYIDSPYLTINTINDIPSFTAYGNYAGPGAVELTTDETSSSAYTTKDTITGNTVDHVMYVNFTSLGISSDIFELIVTMKNQLPTREGVWFNVSTSAPSTWNESDPNLPKETPFIQGTQSSNNSCNDNADNDLDYYTDCKDSDCLGIQIGVTAGTADPIRCESPETTCWDGFDNDNDDLVDCADPDCNGSIGAYHNASGIPVKYNTGGTPVYCEQPNEGDNNYTAPTSSCADYFDNDADGTTSWLLQDFYCNSSLGSNDCINKGIYYIDCFDAYSCWAKNGTGTGICPQFESNNPAWCSDGLDNDYDAHLQGSSANWKGIFIPDPGLDNTGADCDDYDCFGLGSCQTNETLNSTGHFNASQCFDNIDNDLDKYYWNGSDYVENTSTGIDCSDPDCLGVTDPATGRTCVLREFEVFVHNLANNSIDDDADGRIDCLDNLWNLTKNATSITNLNWTDAWARFGWCGPCPTHENYTWESCADDIDNDYDNGLGTYETTSSGSDCADSECVGEIGTYYGAVCVASGQENNITLCSDGFDNDADGNIDCADPDCTGIGICTAENTVAACTDGYDNDRDGYRDCADTGCWGVSGCIDPLNDWSHASCIDVPRWASGTVGTGGTVSYRHQDRLYRGDRYILELNGSAANGDYTSVNIIIAENREEWGKRFPYNTTQCTLEGPNSGNFSWTPEDTGYSGTLSGTSYPMGPFSIYLNCTTPASPQPSRSYEIAVFSQPGSESKTQTVYTQLYEDELPTVSRVEVGGNISNVIEVPYNGYIDLKALPSDAGTYDSGICDCEFDVDGTTYWAGDSNCVYQVTGLTADDSSYQLRTRARDGADNIGSFSPTQTFNLKIKPKETTTNYRLSRAFYNSSITSLNIGSFTFTTGTGDTFGDCNTSITNTTGDIVWSGTVTKSGTNPITCSGTIDISSIAPTDGMYYVRVNVTDTDGDTVQSKAKVFYVCNSLTSSGPGWTCAKADFDLDGWTEGLNTSLYGDPNMVCDMCPGQANTGLDDDADGIDNVCDVLLQPSALSIWDETDPAGGSNLRYPGMDVRFYARYTSGGSPITGANCQIAFGPSPTGPYPMIFDVGTGNYWYNRTFSEPGLWPWNVTCTKTDYESKFASDAVNISSPVKATLVLKLTIPDNTHQVHIPGVGVKYAYQLDTGPTTWSDPPHYYIASWMANRVFSLVHSYRTPVSIGFERTGDNHTLILTQQIDNSQAFLVFTQGNWQKIDNRMALIESLDFLTKIAPTFGFGLGYLYPIKVVLVSSTNLLNDLILQKGTHEVSFEREATGIRITAH